MQISAVLFQLRPEMSVVGHTVKEKQSNNNIMSAVNNVYPVETDNMSL